MVTILVGHLESEAQLWFRAISSKGELSIWTRIPGEFMNTSYLEATSNEGSGAKLYDVGSRLLRELYQQENANIRRYVAKVIFKPECFGVEMLGLPEWELVLPEVRAGVQRVIQDRYATFVVDERNCDPRKVEWLRELLARFST